MQSKRSFALDRPLGILKPGLWKELGILLALLSAAILSLGQTADFSASATSVCPGVFIDFTDASTTGPGTVTYDWDFPGGFPNSDTIQNPAVFYPTPGTYPVSLTVCEGGSCDTEFKAGYITVHSNPSSDFNWNIPSICNGTDVDFTATATGGDGPIVDWFWDFGDGSGASTANPSHTFPAVGNFDVLLLVTDAFGCQADTLITVTTNSLLSSTINMDTSLACGAGPLSVNFLANASGGLGPYNYSWDFGDGGSASGSTVNNVYSGCGTYDVSVTVTDQNLCSMTQTMTDAVDLFCPTVDFFVSEDTLCVGEVLYVVDSSAPAPDQMFWQFDITDPTSTSNGFFPTYSYPAAGTYTMQHCVSYNNGCSDCITRDIVVQNVPLAGGIAISDSLGCSFPFTTTLMATGGVGTGTLFYEWEIGDSTYYGSVINLTINEPVVWDVSLIVSDATGCTDTITRQQLIRVREPLADFVALPEEGCAPVTIDFANLSWSSIIPLDSFYWDFGDGTTLGLGAADTVSHTYTATGDYEVELIAFTELGCTDTTTFTVQVGEVNALIELVDDTICNFVQVLNLTENAEWATIFWGNGDSTILGDPLGNASYTYYVEDTTLFYITLEAYYNGCFESYTVPVWVRPSIPGNPYMIRDCSDPYTVTFGIDSGLTFGAYCWNYGTGDTLCNQNPFTITFPSVGNYIVTLRDPDNPLLDSACISATFNVWIIDEVADFSADVNAGCAPLDVAFTNSNTDTLFDQITYTWIVGPGIINGLTDTFTVVGDSFDLTFPIPDIYPVRMSAFDTTLCDISYLDTIIASEVTPYFNIDSIVGCAPATVYFSDSSFTPDLTAMPIVSWEWTFDNATCPDHFGQNPPPCTYDPGTYDVYLRVRDANGCTEVYTEELTIYEGNVNASFSYVEPVCGNDTVYFSNLSTGDGIAQYVWDFGDGNSSSEADPQHVYAADGVYFVRLTAVDSNGCFDSRGYNINVSMDAIDPGFTINYLSSNTCPPIPVELTDTSLGSVNTQWIIETSGGDVTYFTDVAVHTYNEGGLYDITLIVQDAFGCIDTLTREEAVFISGPTGEMTVSPQTGCAPVDVFFDLENINATQSFIDFGDGDTLEVFGDFYYTYDSAGVFCPRLILIDSSGCETSFNCPSPVTIYATPLADLNFGDSILCAGDDFMIYDGSDSSTIGGTIFVDYGDGTLDTLITPYDSVAHEYPLAGTYLVEAISTNSAGCADTLQITVSVDASPFANLSMSLPNGCAPFSTYLEITGLFADSAWLDYGDGTGDTVSTSVLHTYTDPGVYYPELRLTNGVCNVRAGISDSVVVAYSPEAVLEVLPDTFVCRGGSFDMVNQSIDSITDPLLNAIDDIELWFDVIQLYSGPGFDTVSYSPAIAGMFDIRLIASNQHGCTDEVLRTVVVLEPPVAIVPNDFTTCPGLPVILDASATESNLDISWSPPSLVTHPDSAFTEATVDSATWFQLVVSDGNCTDTAELRVEVLNQLDLLAGPDVEACEGISVNLPASIDTDILGLEWMWSPSAGLDDPGALNPLASVTQDAAYTITATCGDLEESGIVFLDILPNPEVEIDGNLTPVILGSSIDLLAVGSGGTGNLQYQWEPSDDLSCLDCPNPIATPTEDGSYLVQVTDEQGCVDEDTIYLRVFEDCLTGDFDIGKAFTPNMDGKNDLFRYQAETIESLTYFRVYDRWGELVFETNEVGKGWNGRFRDKPMNPGVYVWTMEGICINKATFMRSGDVTLIR
jgi:gliding motility-associated-like protein